MASFRELKLETTKLFGREHEIQLLDSLRKDPKRSLNHSTVLLHGPAGSGRSSLILSQPWKEQGWLLATGKYESANLEPYSALIEAINNLVEQWVLIQQNKNNSISNSEQNNSTDSSQFQAFQSLLQEVSEVMRPILPNVYAFMPTTEASRCDGENVIRTSRKSMRPDRACRGTIRTHLNSLRPDRSARSSLAVKQDLGTVDCVHGSFLRILSCLCQTHPVVLFLDDVHLADKASLDVLGVLATSPQIQGIFLALSYQNETAVNSSSWNETLAKIRCKCVMASAHFASEEMNEKTTMPLESTEEDTNEINKSSENNVKESFARIPVIHELHIRDLDLNSVNSMVASIVQRSVADTMSLSKVIHKKTAGNPFFVLQFLRMLKQDAFLHFSIVSFQWEWGDVEKLAKNAGIMSNVADIVSHTMQHGCKPSTLIALKVASCFGKIIPLQVLLEWFEQNCDSQESCTCSDELHLVKLEGLYNVLEDAVQQGILIRAVSPSQDHGALAYRWANDKLQAVAYSWIEEKNRPILHRKLGKLLWQMNQQCSEQEWMVFMAAEQMNRYSQMNETGEGDVLGADVAALCLEAAELSMSRSALYPAYDMLLAGIKHLGKDKWSDDVDHYELSLELFGTLADLAYQLGKRQDASNYASEVELNAKTLEDKFHGQVVALKCLTSGSDRNYNAGVERAMQVLKEYDVQFPTSLLPGQLMMECNKVKRKFPGEKWDSILDLPEMNDERTMKIMTLLLNHLANYILMGQQKNSLSLSWYAAVRGLNLSVRHGVCEETAFCFTYLGWAYRSQGKLKAADELGELALKVVNRFPQTVGSQHSGVMIKVTMGIYTSTRPINNCLDLFLEGHAVGLRTGMSENASLCVFAYVLSYVMVGLPLGPLKLDLIQFEKEALQFNLPESMLVLFKILQQFIINLDDPISGHRPSVLKGRIMDQDEMLKNLQGNALRMTKRDIDTHCLILALVYGEWERAEKLLGEVEPFLSNDMCVVRATLRRCTMGLVAFKLSRGKQGIARRRLRSMGKEVIADLHKNLKDGNVNSLPLYAMLKAEEAPSKERYDFAIRACARLGLLHFEAYMCEAAALFFLEQKDEGWSEIYMAQAFSLYREWGAMGKANQLKQSYTKLLRSACIDERVNTALKGRSRYNSEHADLLKDFDWDRLSTSSLSTNSTSTICVDNSEEDDSTSSDNTKMEEKPRSKAGVLRTLQACGRGKNRI